MDKKKSKKKEKWSSVIFIFIFQISNIEMFSIC